MKFRGLLVTLALASAALAQDGAYCVFRHTIAHDAMNEVTSRNDWIRVGLCSRGGAQFGTEAWGLWPGTQPVNMTMADALAFADWVVVNDNTGWQRDCCKQFTLWQKGPPNQLSYAVTHGDATMGSQWRLSDTATRARMCCEDIVDYAIANSYEPALLPGTGGDCRRVRLYTGAPGGAIVLFTAGGVSSLGPPIAITPPGNVRGSQVAPYTGRTARAQDPPVTRPRREEPPVVTPPTRRTEPPRPEGPGTWKLVSTASDPGKKSERRPANNNEETWTLAQGTYRHQYRVWDWTQDGKNTRFETGDCTQTFTFDSPPSSLRPGDEFDLKINAAFVVAKGKGCWAGARIEGPGCRETGNTVPEGESSKSGVISFHCKVPEAGYLRSEFDILQIGSGAGVAGAFHYCKDGVCGAGQ